MHIVGRDGDVTLDFKHAFDRDGGWFLGRFIAFEPEFEGQNIMYAQRRVLLSTHLAHQELINKFFACNRRTGRIDSGNILERIDRLSPAFFRV